MKIEIHCLLHNEALMLPYFIRHYYPFADIIFYESNSTDGSAEIAKFLYCKVVKVENKSNLIDENLFLKVKNNCWKNSDADWVIITDTDEFVYSPDLLKILKDATHTTMFQPKEYLMYSRKFPTTNGQIYDQVKKGIPGNSGFGKINIFRPSQIKEINYAPGCHVCKPEGNVKICRTERIKTLHYHFAGLEYRLQKNRYISTRISENNKIHGFGVHCTWPEKEIRRDFNKTMKTLIQVIP